ncbi:MAG: restriction endonuclease subunit S [Gammaproteobacteria bacterium]|nr:restriction endonuclease subunit S [Gammaproteobacteria bacterium]
MMLTLTKLELQNVCEKIVDCEHKTAPVQKEGFPSIRTPNIGRGRLILDGVNRVSEETWREWTKREIPQSNDLILAREAPLGNVAIVPSNTKLCLGQRTVLLRPDKKKVISRFLCYLILSPQMQYTMHSRGGGATVSHLNVKEIRKLPVFLPPLQTQQKIAGILSTYDDLIENNLQRIKLLEEMAQITYEEWLLFRRIDGKRIMDKEISLIYLEEMIKEYRNGGWGKEEAEGYYTEPAYVIRGTDIPDIKAGNINNVPLRYHTAKNLAPRRLIPGDISIEMSNGNIGNVGRSFYFDDGTAEQLGGSVMCASFCKLLRPKNIGLSYMIDVHLKYIHKNNQMLTYKSQGANGINNFRFEDMISEEQIPIPKEKHLKTLVKQLEAAYFLCSTLRQQNQLLKEARDILLPRLMTGMIDVEKIELPEALLARVQREQTTEERHD